MACKCMRGVFFGIVIDCGVSGIMAERRPVSPPPEHHEEPVFRDEMYASGALHFTPVSCAAVFLEN